MSSDVIKTSPVTREEFERLVDAYADAFGGAVLAAGRSAEQYAREAEKAIAAKQELIKAVFP